MKKKLILILVLLICLCGNALASQPASGFDAKLSKAVGDRAWLMRQVQQRLIDLGYLNDKADGIYGKKTAAALRAFQKKSGLEETGILDETTLELLKRTLPNGESGAVGDDRSVKSVQQKLIELGYLNGKADGAFGKQSRAAMALYQRINGFDATGELDSASLDSLFSEGAHALPAGLTAKDSGEEVIQLQQRLSVFGFFSGEADGTYGKETVEAVKRFQQHLIEQGYRDDYGISESGDATPVTRYFLENDRYTSYLRDVAVLEESDEALRIETRLYNLGYMDVRADDTLDEYGMEALRLFADQYGVEVGDSVGQMVIDMLFSDAAKQAPYCAPHDVKYGDTGRAVLDLENALVKCGMMTKIPDGKYNKEVETAVKRLRNYLKDRKSPYASLIKDSRAMSKEAQRALQDNLPAYVTDVGKKRNAAETARVQRRLHTLYYLSQKYIDGKPGEKTRGAIQEFQVANGLIGTGIADRETQEILFSDRAKTNPLPYIVRVSIERQVVEVYQKDIWGQYSLVKTFECSTGRNNSTPRGVFMDGHPVNRWHYFKKFNCWAQYSFRIKNDIMFHSVLYSSKNENALRKSSLNNIGSPASHGCIRLQVEDAQWLFEHCERGSLVVVIT